MVKNCAIDHYDQSDDEKYKEHFEKYPHKLSIFQKHAIQGIVEGNHVLITAHTGSGKTLAGEFAIEHFVSKGKKVIYTMPIKSIGNQKFYEFSKKYPHISFGLITGDIKTNSDAQVIIMTAEILLNKLRRSNQTTASSTSFDMNIEKELACVIMDEVHYINDSERGKTWEETIILLPKQVQMVMLSATIDAPERFANWCETRHTESGKTVVLASTYTRIVPLTHYAFVASPSALFKTLKDKTKEEDLKQHVFEKMLTIHTAQGEFQEPTFHILKNTLQLLHTKQVFVKRQFVLNQVCKHMVERNMLPALCFVLSRKMLEQCAQEITVPLLEDDSKVGYVIEQECEQIIRKLPNYKEYLNLPEYVQMVSLLKKGVAIHHAGVMPVLKEMVELLYSKGYIKLLFATETFAVGVNMPTKTVLFTDICKFDGSRNRLIHSHEYTQMAGRAGRRGIDDVGNVIHLPNLYREFEITGFRNMLRGGAQKLVSKFKISYDIVFNIISINANNVTIAPSNNDLSNNKTTISDFNNHVKQSLIQDELSNESINILNNLVSLKEEINVLEKSFHHLRTPLNVIQNYVSLSEQRPNAINKKRKEIDRAINQLVDDHKFIEKDKLTIIKYNDKMNEMRIVNNSLDNSTGYINNKMQLIIKTLIKFECILETKEENGDGVVCYGLTHKGTIASHIKETNCLVFSDLFETRAFDAFSAKHLATIFSCFTNVSVSDDNKATNCDDICIGSIISRITSSFEELLKEENDNNLNTGSSYDIHYDLFNYVSEWWECDSEIECKLILQKMTDEKGIFLGEFVKALLKINNISAEFETIAELNCDVELLHKLREIPFKTLKFVATNQSLYV